MALHTLVELWPCLYRARCRKEACGDLADVLACYVDEQDRTLRQMEFCACHANALDRSFAVRDMR
jgi:hypothetical protein